MSKDVKQLLKVARDLHYSIKRYSNNHYNITGNGHSFTVASTPRCGNTVVSIRNRIIRLGENRIDKKIFRYH